MTGFNGAALFQVRKVDLPTCQRVFALPCFNGAALFQVRKGARLGSASQIRGWASMGPHSFKCGKNRLEPAWLGKEVKLQWGRTLSSAERITSKRASGSLITSLQWGRTLSSAESKRASQTFNGVWSASMGPHSFKCGKLYRQSVFKETKESFNGAALFQVRKAGLAWLGLEGLGLGFNGAALFQVRKAGPESFD